MVVSAARADHDCFPLKMVDRIIEKICIEARRSPDELEAYFEMHIEQASVLDTYGEQLGIVEGIAGYVWL
ncbi:MAG: hypothetical protein IKN20_06815, partial [Firmicutes bacterium]|nr:hypothetical protein [Bacillota bacterium]